MASGTPRSELLNRASDTLNTILELDELLKTILDIAQEGLDADRGTVYIVDHEKKEIWSKVFMGDDFDEIRMKFHTGITGHVVNTGEVVNVPDAYDHPKFNSSFDKTTGYTTKSMLTVPIANNQGRIVGVFQMINRRNGCFDDADVEFLRSLANYSAVAIEMAAMHEMIVDKERMDHELEIARTIQQRLFPHEEPVIPGYDLFGCNISCDRVSGDYYEIYPVGDNRCVFAIGDVSGHGIPSALVMAVVQSHIKALSKLGHTVVEITEELNEYLCAHSDPENYITLHIGVLNRFEHTYRYVNAGHSPPVLIERDGSLRELRTGGPLIGALRDVDFGSETIALNPGDLIYCFTDGVTEIFDERREQFGEKRLYEYLRDCRDKPLDHLFEGLIHLMHTHAGGKLDQDDVTVVALRRKDG